MSTDLGVGAIAIFVEVFLIHFFNNRYKKTNENGLTQIVYKSQFIFSCSLLVQNISKSFLLYFLVQVTNCSKFMMPVNGAGLLSLNRYATQYFTVSTYMGKFTFELFVKAFKLLHVV